MYILMFLATQVMKIKLVKKRNIVSRASKLYMCMISCKFLEKVNDMLLYSTQKLEKGELHYIFNPKYVDNDNQHDFSPHIKLHDFYFFTYFHPITSTRQHVHVNQQITSHLYSFFVTYQRVWNLQRKNVVNSFDVLFTNVTSSVYIYMLHTTNIHHQYQNYSLHKKSYIY